MSRARVLLDRFREREGEILRLARALVEEESPSGDEAGSRGVVSLLVDAARINGVAEPERLPVPGYGEHFLWRARASGGDDGGSLLLLGHTDTVHPRGSTAERPWKRQNGRIYGPGVYDMKTNCALAVYAVRACVELDLMPRRDVNLLLTCDEESGSASGRAVIETLAAHSSHALVLEPSGPGGAVKTGRKGTGIFTIEVHGRAAHAGLEPEKGINAVLEIARHIQRLHSLAEPSRGTTVNVGVVHGGTRNNVVPAHAYAEVDVRFTTKAEGERMEREIMASAPFDERARVLVSGGINRPPLERTPQVLGLYERARQIAALLDFELPESQVGGASDGNFIAALGVPVLDGLGVEGDGAHAAHEHIIAGDIPRRGALLAALIATL